MKENMRSDEAMQRVTVITISMNDARFIEDCLKSVDIQDYPEVEHVVIDGGSTDGTLEILRQHPPRNGFVISEKDDGIYDAINKGIRNSRGEIISILNSDNFYARPDVVSLMVNAMQTSRAKLAYADAHLVDPQNVESVQRVWESGEFSERAFRRGWMPPHQTVFLYRDLHNSYGVYNTTLRIASDYEFLLRLLIKNRVGCAYLPKVIVKARAGGVSNRSLRTIIQSNMEVAKAWRMNGLTPPLFLPVLKPLSKLKQFLTAQRKNKA